MKSIALSAILVAIASSSYLSDVLQGSCMTCTDDSDCYDYYQPSNESGAIWECSSTIVYNDNSTNVVNICLLNQCDYNAECPTDETCQRLTCCDMEDEQYDNSTGLYSSICLPDICDDDPFYPDINDTCYEGSNGEIYYSVGEAMLCGDTCVVDEEACEFMSSLIPSSTESSDCVVEETCCHDPFDFNGCLELLTTEWLYFFIGGIVLIFCCYCTCCYLCYRRYKSTKEDYTDMDQQTNHYNVYI